MHPLKQIPKKFLFQVIPSFCLLWAPDLAVLPSKLARFVWSEQDYKVKWSSLAPMEGKDLENKFFLGIVLGILEGLIKRGAFWFSIAFWFLCTVQLTFGFDSFGVFSVNM